MLRALASSPQPTLAKLKTATHNPLQHKVGVSEHFLLCVPGVQKRPLSGEDIHRKTAPGKNVAANSPVNTVNTHIFIQLFCVYVFLQSKRYIFFSLISCEKMSSFRTGIIVRDPEHYDHYRLQF